MKNFIFQVNHQLGVNRNNRHQLERDLANKDGAIAIGKFVSNCTRGYFDKVKIIGQFLGFLVERDD